MKSSFLCDSIHATTLLLPLHFPNVEEMQERNQQAIKGAQRAAKTKWPCDLGIINSALTFNMFHNVRAHSALKIGVRGTFRARPMLF